MAQNPTIRDVAKEAEVSASTVSMVLNGRSSVKPETHRRIMTAMEKLGYRPTGVGRPTLNKKAKNIAILYSPWAMSHGQVTQLSRAWINGIRDTITPSGAQISLFAGTEHVEQDLMFQQVVEAHEIDGIIFIGTLPQYGYLEWTLQHDMPTVVMNRKPKQCEFSHVSIDNYGIGPVVMKYLANLGHQNIALALGEEPSDEYAPGRNAGIELGLKTTGLNAVVREYLPANPSESDIKTFCQQVLDSGATAVQTYGDLTALALIEQWQKMGVNIPQDLTVIGFDDLGCKTEDGKRITSIGFNKQKMGQLAGQMLLNLIDQADDICQKAITVKTYITEHDTHAPPPQN